MVCALAACGAEGTKSWELAHDRVIAIRATPPRIAAGDRATIDVLVTSERAGPAEVAPASIALAPGNAEALGELWLDGSLVETRAVARVGTLELAIAASDTDTIRWLSSLDAAALS